MSSDVRRSKNSIKWALFLLAFHLAAVTLDRFSSRRQARNGVEGDNETVESAQSNTQLKGSVRWYLGINRTICFLVLVTTITAWISVLCCHNEEFLPLAVFSLINVFIFGYRSIWMSSVNKRGYQVTNDPDAYSLERTTSLAWMLLIFFVTARSMGIDLAPKAVTETITTLILLTPIFSISGSSWGKLKAIKLNGDKIAWPCLPGGPK
ncbi:MULTISPECIES: hypothetical protein [unclassified Corynebacterium]|uniref:hypothetical protein n=1 Tax=Corynebacterium TaxID=1716 RepID=UPI0025518A19|nr:MULTISPECIES: hypothetical protein [unclassified Corynebacterium]MDK8468347.1 hypothetical protein [Corynebacterium sp. MSK130]MDK8477241.1 hypothetical protein [Corynebacterium sp. MSK310]MDK8648777.1 hypothetical protein [Corynebacterium sp. MSK082]MDK8673784.1 hypothetical protein [Corynebacterium sp. MSK189]MDK8688904.1 hypothetical protein [Corynebacterium sp. MSK122]